MLIELVKDKAFKAFFIVPDFIKPQRYSGFNHFFF